MSNELKPCPFCGSTVGTKRKDNWVKCCDCSARGSQELDRDTAHISWNNRPIEDALKARVEELEKLLMNIHGDEKITIDRIEKILLEGKP